MEIERILDLARIELTEEEKKIFKEQLKSIINWVNELNEIDTTSIKPVFSITQMTNNLREDEVREFKNRRLIIDNFPEKEYDFAKVKKVIE